MKETYRAVAVVVLYNQPAFTSRTVQALRKSFAAYPELSEQIFICLYDNSTDRLPVSPDLFPSPFRLAQPGRNAGIAAAYNEALEYASGRGIRWLLLLDSDTEAEAAFLRGSLALLDQLERDHRIAALVPHIVEDGRVHAPRWVRPLRRNPLPLAFTGVADHEIVTVNSGTWVKVAIVREAGGFNPLFWLDYLDYWLFRHLYRSGYKVFVTGHHLEHSLSFADPVHRMTPERYRNMLEAERRFVRLFGTPWERVRRKLVLLRRALRFAFVDRRARFVALTLKFLAG